MIKVGLDRGSEPGAPWSDPSHGPANPPPPWSLLDIDVLRAIVDEAHRHGRLVTAELAHNEIPWGIDAEELHLMLHLEGLSPIEAFRAATSAAG